MPLTVVVGGQYGSEAKGKVAYDIATRIRHNRPDMELIATRTGGANAGHTVIHNGETYKLRHLPCTCVLSNVAAVIGAGAYINPDLLLGEVARFPHLSDLIIDPMAVIIDDSHTGVEEDGQFHQKIGSTGSGTGAATAARVLRDPNLLHAKDHPELKKYVWDTKYYLRSALNMKTRIISEGTQGFGLSLYHSGHYPHCTSRDTTAAAVISELGVSPFDVDEIFLVIRAHPIRVAGTSGPLPGETTWEEVSSQSGSEEYFDEFTTVTKKKRRVGFFDPAVVRAAITVNQPTRLVMCHLDYIDINVVKTGKHTEKTKAFVNTVERQIGRQIDYFGIGPDRPIVHWKCM